MMVQYLYNLDIPVWLHEKLVDLNFSPEQTEHAARLAPATFDEFVKDLHSIVASRSGCFRQWISRVPFRAESGSVGLNFYTDTQQSADDAVLATAWAGLKLGVLTVDQFGGSKDSIASFLFPVLCELPYVKSLNARSASGDASGESVGLYFNQFFDGTELQQTKLVA